MTDHTRVFPTPPGREFDGIELRDYFAAHALQGLLANPKVKGAVLFAATLASEAYECADQMMVERSHD